MMHGQKNIKLSTMLLILDSGTPSFEKEKKKGWGGSPTL